MFTVWRLAGEQVSIFMIDPKHLPGRWIDKVRATARVTGCLFEGLRLGL